MQPHEAAALQQMRETIDAIEEILAERREPPEIATEIVAAPAAGIDVICLPIYFCEHPVRADVTRRVLRHLRRVAEEVDAVVIGVGSEGDISRDLWREFFDVSTYSEYPQVWARIGPAGHPLLRAKFDETLRRCAIYNPARVFIGGSDDIIPMEWFRRAFKSDADLVGVTGGAHVVRIDGGSHLEIWEWDGKYPGHGDIEFCGGGFLLSRNLLDAWDWAPFKDSSDEIGVERRARRRHFIVEGIEGRYWAAKVPGAVLNAPGMAPRYGATQAGQAVRAEWTKVWAGLAS